MTKLAIIGGGIAGRSLLYALAKRKKNFSEIVLFDSDSFAHTCSLRSTAIVAARGVSPGHSELGDLLMAGFKTFTEHVKNDLPKGVFPITQYSGTLTKLDQFQKRYPLGNTVKDFPAFSLAEPTYMATESAYLIDTDLYLRWLMDEAWELSLTVKNEFVTAVDINESGIAIKTQIGNSFSFDQVIFAGGSYNRYWDPKKAGKPVQGSYLEFSEINLGSDSFSLNLEGDNFIYHAHTQKLLVGSTTNSDSHEFPATQALQELHLRLSERLEMKLPLFATGKMLTGIREKAPKRSPYVSIEGNTAWLGGLYKNGFALSLHLGLQLVDRFPSIPHS